MAAITLNHITKQYPDGLVAVPERRQEGRQEGRQAGEAPVQVDSSVPEKFVKTSLDRVTSAEDPLQIVTRSGGHAQNAAWTPRVSLATRSAG